MSEEKQGHGQPQGKKNKKQKKAEKQSQKSQERSAHAKAVGEHSKIVAERAKLMSATPQLNKDLAHIRSHPYLNRPDDVRLVIQKGFVKNMKVDGICLVSDPLLTALIDELDETQAVSTVGGRGGGFIPSICQVANVAALPGVVGNVMAMPDIHCGYGFAIGCVAAIDCSDPKAVVSPGGVGFDINCGVRLLRTNLDEKELTEDLRERLATKMYENIPVGVGSSGKFSFSKKELDVVLEEGMKYMLKKEFCWQEDIDRCEENGCFPGALSDRVSIRAKKRGLSQMGTLGSGNHYVELQVVEEVFDQEAAQVMGLALGRVVVMLHSGSRGLGHQVCTDYLMSAETAKYDDGSEVLVNDRQLAAAPLESKVGKDYLAAMAAAGNFAFVNRTIMAHLARQSFEEVMGKSARELDMHMIYDVSHNIAKFETHIVDGEEKRVLVHRKGATRCFPPGHSEIPEEYKEIGQPVLIGGSMGTCSYVLTGTEKAMEHSFGSTCHGAGRELSRGDAMRALDSRAILQRLQSKGIIVKVAKQGMLAEEAAEAYKDVDKVVQTCADAGISKLVVKLRPITVIKG